MTMTGPGHVETAGPASTRAEKEEGQNAERTVRSDDGLSEAEEPKMSEVRICDGVSLAACSEMGVWVLQFHRLRSEGLSR